MLKEIYSRARAALAGHRASPVAVCSADGWRRDPLSHPILDAMDLSQLADLPPAALRSCCRE